MTRRLFVSLRRSGRTYTYHNVPEAVYADFLRAHSKGQFYADHARDYYSLARFLVIT